MIRRAGAHDVEAIAAIFGRSSATLSFLPRLHTDEEHRAFFAGCVAEGEGYVYEGDRILGFAILAGDVLTQLYVEPDAFGRGVGSALLATAKERRPDGFTLWVFQQNERARRFYESRGCRLVELGDGSGNEERVPDALYAWP